MGDLGAEVVYGEAVGGPAAMALAKRGVALREWTSGDPFEEHPHLASIWPDPFSAFAREEIAETIHLGGLYLIERAGRAIGVTGFFQEDPDSEILYLRWHGIEGSERDKGLSAPILAAVLELAMPAHSHALALVEMAPLCAYGEGIERHFRRVGFEKLGGPEFLDWSGMHWQPYCLDIGPFMGRFALASGVGGVVIDGQSVDPLRRGPG